MKLTKEQIARLQRVGHGKPVSRRDFLSQGLIGAAAVSMAPALMSAIPFRAFADANCSTGTVTNDFIPFLVFDMVGGAALPANFLVGGKNGSDDLLPSYNRLGWDPVKTGVDKRFGLPAPAGNVGKIFQGMITAMSAEAQALTKLGGICHEAQSDTSSNTTSCLIDVTTAGFRGTTFSTGLGMVASNSGGNTGVPKVDVQIKPVNVTSVTDLMEAAGYASMPGTPTKEGLTAMASANIDLNMSQAGAYMNYERGKELNELVECGYKKNYDLLISGSDLDPRLNPTFQQVFNINAQTAPASKEAITSTVIMNTINKTSGPGCVILGGCDYHDGTSTTGDAKDLEMGTLIGRSIEAAHRLKKPLFFQLVTDGGCSNSVGTRLWQSDDNGKCMTVMGFYNPNKKVESRRTQLGHFAPGQSADRDTFLGRNTTLVSYAVLANYLMACGKIDLFEKMVPNTVFPKAMIDEVMMFA